jgi:hypothetical protein
MPVKRVFSSPGEILLAAQPFLAVPLFLSSLVWGTVFWLALALALLPVAVRWWKERRPSRRTSFDTAVILLMLCLVVGVLSSPDKAASLHSAVSFLACMLLYYGFVNNSQRTNGYWLFTAGLFLIGVLAASAGYFSSGPNAIHLSFNEWIFRLTSHLPKFGGSIVGISLLSTVLAPLLPFVLALDLSVRLTRIRLALILSSMACALLLVLSGIGGVWLVALVGSTIVIACWRPDRMWWLVPLYGFAILVFVSFFYHVAWLRTVIPVESLNTGISMWSRTLDLLNGKLLTGLGLGQWSALFGKAYGYADESTHSTLVQAATDFGLLGVLFVLWGAVSAVKVFRRILAGKRYDNIWFAVGIGMIAFAVQPFVDNSLSFAFLHKGTYCYLASPVIWFWAAMLVVCRDKVAV